MSEVVGTLASLPQALLDLDGDDPDSSLAGAVVVSSIRRDWREQADDATRALLAMLAKPDLDFETQSQAWKTLLLLTKAGVPSSAPSTRQAVAQLAQSVSQDACQRDEFRCEAVGVLGLLWPDQPATPEALNILASGLASGDAAVQLAAATAVGRYKHRGIEHLERHAYRIATTYLCDEDAERRVAALAAMTALGCAGHSPQVTRTVRGGYDVIQSVEALLCDDDLEVQIAAASFLADLGARNHIEGLELMLGHVENPYADVRLTAARSWGRLATFDLDRGGDEEAADVLARDVAAAVVGSDLQLSMLAVQTLAWLSVARPEVAASYLPGALEVLIDLGRRGSAVPVLTRLLSFRAWAELYSCLEVASKTAAEVAARNLGGDEEEEGAAAAAAGEEVNGQNVDSDDPDEAADIFAATGGGAGAGDGDGEAKAKSDRGDASSNLGRSSPSKSSTTIQRKTPSSPGGNPNSRMASRASNNQDRASVKSAKSARSAKSTKTTASGAADAGQVLAALGPDVQGQDQQVLEQLSHPRAEVRNAAGRALAEMGEHGIGQLALALKHPDWKVRIAAANALRDKGFEDAHSFVPLVAND